MGKETLRIFLDLPQSTAHCEEGPLIDYAMGMKSPSVVHVRYDVEGYDERNGEAPVWSPIWTKVSFTHVMAIRFTPEYACTEIMIDAYSRLCEVVDSHWLASMRKLFKEAHEEIPPEFRHFMIFFDHYGCLEVIAAEVEVGDD